MRYHENTRSLDSRKPRMFCESHFCERMKFALSFRFFDSWYIIKYLLTETSGKQYVLWNIDSLGSTKHNVSLGLSKC